MPLVTSKYKPPFHYRNGHVATIIPSAFRKVIPVNYTRERINTPDDDFLDLDWSVIPNSDRLVIVSHGLEGSSGRPYVMGMVEYFNRQGWSALAWNCRSCSGEINNVPKFYHHGATEDLTLVVDHALSREVYKQVVLVGFSMGGSMTLKYLGESSRPQRIRGGIAFSVPVDLKSSVDELALSKNKFYRRRFLKKLAAKIKVKAEKFPDIIDAAGVDQITHFPEFDNRYTAPLHGFKNADDFYDRASAKHFIENIDRPTLLVNAYNDPFLSPECYPTEMARNHQHFFFESPSHGGHVGFTMSKKGSSYMDLRAFHFIDELLS